MRGLCSVIFLLSLIALTTSTAVLQLQGDDFQTHLESHSPIVVNCELSMLNFVDFINLFANSVI
jgi:hypothetical protein